MKRFRAWLAGLGVACVFAAAYLSFELGRYEAGYALLDHQRERTAHRRLTAEQERAIDGLKRQIAILETSRDIDRETYAQLERSLAELEIRLQAQEEELAFYRGIISPPDGVPGLRIQSAELAPGDADKRYTLRLVLVQAIAQNRRVAGVVRLRVIGTRGGEMLELGPDELGVDGAGMEYDFRYFQGLEQELLLPEAFTPSAVEVEIDPTTPRGAPLARTFEWAAIGGGEG